LHTVTKRLVFHIGGYDPISPPDGAYRRFLRELKRFERTWSVKADVESPDISSDAMKWTVIASGPDWRVASHYQLIRWDDVIQAQGDEPLWRRLLIGVIVFLDFAFSGPLWGYVRANWHYALVFSFTPLFFLGLLVTLALVVAWRSCRVGLLSGALAERLLRGAACWPLALAALGASFRRLDFLA